MVEEKESRAAAGKFGVFGGVFTPGTRTIPGAIMFLRFGQVAGSPGFWHAIMIILAAKAVQRWRRSPSVPLPQICVWKVWKVREK